MKTESLFCGITRAVFGKPETQTPAKQCYVKPPKADELDKMGNAELPFLPEGIIFRTTTRGCVLELPLAPGEDIYGLGLQLKNIRHTGRKRTIRVNSDPVADTGDSHAPAPLYFSTAGYGVFFDTARYASFWCGGSEKLQQGKSSAQQKHKVALKEEELYANEGKASAPMVVEVPVAEGIEVYFFAGPSLADAVRRYILFCGGGCLVPEWSLGLWYRACGTADQHGVENLATELRERGIPCDVLGLEPGWQTHSYSCSYVWNRSNYPSHRAMLKRLTDQHFHINLWEHLFVHPSSPIYQKLEPYSGSFKVWKGEVPDFSLPEAISVFSNYHKKNLTTKGISSFKLDECDNSDYTGGWSYPECAEFPSGKDGEQMHSMMGMLYMNVIMNSFDEPGHRMMGSVRSSHAFAPPMPFVLYSDLYKHADFIRGMASAGMSGMLWTPEVRSASSKEDYIRRLQTLILSPQMLLNIWAMPEPPWRQLDAEKNRRGELYPEAEQTKLAELTRKAVEMRMSFLPYLYAAFADYHFHGFVPFRPPVMDDPERESLRNVDYAWLAGPSLYTAPFTADERAKDLPLPKGVWYDFETGEKFVDTAHIEPAIDKLPIFVRENSIIPYAEPSLYTEKGRKYALHLRVYGSKPLPAKLFGDDGVSPLPDDGEKYFGTVNAKGIIKGKPKTRYEVVSVMEWK